MKVIDASVETILPHKAEKVLRLVSVPSEIASWHPWVKRIAIYEQQGLLYRRASFVGTDEELVEKLWQDDNEGAFHSQSVQGLWADCLYRSKIQIRDHEEGCVVTWRGRLLRERSGGEAEQVETFYREGLRGLNDLLDAM